MINEDRSDAVYSEASAVASRLSSVQTEVKRLEPDPYISREFFFHFYCYLLWVLKI